MIPLNAPARKSSFFLFLLFFVISVSLVVLVAFYGMQVPFKQNELMKQQIDEFQKDQIFLQNFTGKTAETNAMLDKINKPGVDATFIDSRISANIDTLTRQIGVDSSSRTVVYRNIVFDLQSLQAAKKSLRENSGNDAQVEHLKQDLKDANSRIDVLQKSNDDLRRSGH